MSVSVRRIFSFYGGQAVARDLVFWATLDERAGSGLLLPKLRHSDLVDAFDAIYALHPADIRKNGLELAFIGNLQAGLHTCILPVRTAFQHSNVRACAADDGRNLRQQSGPILGAYLQFHR